MIIIEHCNTQRTYVIPENLCDINLFHIADSALILSTGKHIDFWNQNDAKEAWCIIEECLRKGGTNILISEEKEGMTTGYR